MLGASLIFFPGNPWSAVVLMCMHILLNCTHLFGVAIAVGLCLFFSCILPTVSVQ